LLPLSGGLAYLEVPVIFVKASGMQPSPYKENEVGWPNPKGRQKIETS
jgi:hypothetical protein